MNYKKIVETLNRLKETIAEKKIELDFKNNLQHELKDF